jgi:hypothetical protein
VTCNTADGKAVTLATVRNNFQRLNRHNFDAVDARSIRIEIHSTNGSDYARVFEIRCYA